MSKIQTIIAPAPAPSTKPARPIGFRTQLALSTALASVMLGGYGSRAAYAGDCSPVFFGTYLCAVGANVATDLTQNLSGAPLSVTTTAGFAIDTSSTGGDAFALYSDYGLTFTDNNGSSITGAVYGIYADNGTSGDVSITTTGQVTGVLEDGIKLYNFGGGNVTISTAGVSGGDDGISVNTYDGGFLSITATGHVSGTADEGIDAVNNEFGTGLAITATSVSGGQSGIYAGNFGSGALTVTTTGQVDGGDDGILAVNGDNLIVNAGTDVTINAAGVSGGEHGIAVYNYGSGVVSVTTSGTVTGGLGGIIAVNYYGSDVTVTANGVGGVHGGYGGIVAVNYGSGETTITAAGPVTGDLYDGILAINQYGTGMTIEVDSVEGGTAGITALNSGYGALSITSTGTVTGNGAAYSGFDGIFALNFGTDLTIDVNNVSGVRNGIETVSYGSGPTSITVSGAVTGGTGYGISTTTGPGGMTEITLNAGADVSSLSGSAITNDDGDSQTIVNAGASVTGAIMLGDGSDDLIFDGGDFSGVTSFDGGDDTDSADGFVDTLQFLNGGGSVAGGTIANFENVVIGSGATMAFSDNMLTTSALVIVDGGALDMTNAAADAMTLTGDLEVADGGTLVLEVFSESLFDSLLVSGIASFGSLSGIEFLLDIDAMDLFDGFSIDFLTATDVFGFGNLDFTFTGLDPLYSASVGELDGFMTLTLSSSSAVPEASGLALFGAGLLGLLGVGLARRRSAATGRSDA